MRAKADASSREAARGMCSSGQHCSTPGGCWQEKAAVAPGSAACPARTREF